MQRSVRVSVNWTTTLGVFASGGLLGGGVMVAIVEGFFRNPERRASVTTAYTDVGIKLAQQAQAVNNELRAEKNELLRANDKLQKRIERLLTANETSLKANEKLVAKIHNVREILASIIYAVEEESNTSDPQAQKLTCALNKMRQALNE